MTDWDLLPSFTQYLVVSGIILAILAIVCFFFFLIYYIYKNRLFGKMKTQNARELLSADVAYFYETGKRDNQQDSYYISSMDDYRRRGLVISVADGMGGLKYGDEISDIIVSCIEDAQPMNFNASDKNADIIRRISNNVFDEYRMQGGSTLAMIHVFNNSMHFYSVGDSDIIIIRNGETTILNPRQNYASVLVKKYAVEGVSSSEAYVNRKGRGLIDFMGNHNPRVIYTREPIKLMDEDIVIVCSDGLTDALGTNDLSMYISSDAKSTAEKLKNSIKAKRLHKQDNYTGVVLRLKRGIL